MTMLHHVLVTALDIVRRCPWNWFNVTSKLINSFERCHKSPHIKQNHAPVFGDEKYCADLWAFLLYLYLYCCSQRVGRLKSKAPKQVSLPMWAWDKQKLEVGGILPWGKILKTQWLPTIPINGKVINIQKSFYKPCSSIFSLPEVAPQ